MSEAIKQYSLTMRNRDYRRLLLDVTLIVVEDLSRLTYTAFSVRLSEAESLVRQHDCRYAGLLWLGRMFPPTVSGCKKIREMIAGWHKDRRDSYKKGGK